MISVRPARTRKELREFVEMAWPIYKGNKQWVPPLISDIEAMLTPGKNPFWEHAERELFLAEKDEKNAGRIAATVCWNHNKLYNEKTGFFGFFECVDDQEVAHELFTAASDWLKLRGMTDVRGPLNPNINEEIGLLVEGFDQEPYVMMPYTLPYYPKLVEGEGFKKIKDVYAYEAYTKNGMPEKVERIVELLKKRYNVTVRPINMKKLEEEARLLKAVHDEAWKENWGAVPFTDAEFEHIVEQLKPIAVPDIVPIVEMDGRPVAMAVAVPDANQIIRLANGKLFPFGFLKLLFNQHKITRIRILILGVMSQYRKSGLDALLYHSVFKGVEKHGFKGGEFSWILEDNVDIIRIIESWGSRRTKTYRIYQKPL